MKLRIIFLFFVFVFTGCEPSSTESVQLERANILVSIRDSNNKRIDPGMISQIDIDGRIEIHPGQESVIKGSRTFFGFFESTINCFGEIVDGEVGEVACYVLDESSETGSNEISASIVIDKDPVYEPEKSYMLNCVAFLEDDEPVHTTCSASLLQEQ